MKNFILTICMAVVCALPAMAGWNTAGINKDATIMQPTFHSTSTMQGSGSPHSFQPAGLNEEGRATYDTSEATQNDVHRPRRVPGVVHEGSEEAWLPIGDGVLPLLLMSTAFGAGIWLRRRRAQISSQI